ncbi:MAG TPA: LysM peptidoglycan-binding domain-containing protein [Bacillota bacterium]|nr:LysM peptidoglycan-binding domain-containing protein [Bacillota bacterium]
MNENDNTFLFEIEESLYFKQHQEIDNLLTIGLDPEITIQAYDDYVSVRGVLELTGEYTLKDERDETNLEEIDYTKRYVSEVKETNNDQATFSHLFPVEISIPTYRVKDLNDVTVEITDFDYEAKADDHLVVSAQLNIGGIEQEDTIERESTHIDLDDTTDFDVKLRDKSEEQKTRDEEFEEAEMLSQIEEQKLENDTVIPFEREEIEEQEESTLEDIEEEVEEEEEKESRFLSSLFTKNEDELNYTKVRLCFVQYGDTVETIAERYEVPTLQIVNYNNLESGDLQPGELLYIPHS